MVGRWLRTRAVAWLAVLCIGAALGAAPVAWAADAAKPAKKSKKRAKKSEPKVKPASEWPKQVVDPEVGTPAHVVKQAILLAQAPDASEAFGRYLELMHPDWKHNDRAIRMLEAFSWQRFRRQVNDYVVEGTEGGFMLTRQDPVRLADTDADVRLFLEPLNNKVRKQPTPIRLRRVEGVWLITANSL
jgi:hypothetical protein